MLNIQPGDVNKLRELLAAGLIREEDISSGSFGPSAPPQQNALARILSDQEQFAAGDQSGALPMGSMRNEETGRVTYFKPGGGGFSDRPYPAQGQIPEQAKRPKVRLVGVGNDGSQHDLGEEDARALPVDYTRPAIDIPGLGKGRYTADGRHAVIQNPDGSQTKVVLGYDAAASERRTLRDLKMRELAAQTSEAEARAGLLQDKRTMLAAGPQQTATDAAPALDQKELERIHGKPDKGYRWTQDGKLEPLPDGEVQQAAQTAAEKAADAISQIDALIGGEGRAPHPGFESAVGLSVPKVMGAGFIPGTQTSDFNKRLDQLKGGAFLEAFQTLKGGGQITEVEGKKATAAITRMDTAQSEAEFVAAAKEFRDILARGLEKAKAKGGSLPSAPAGSGQAAAPAQVPPPEQRRLGQAYDTPRGRLIWLGNGWRAP